MAFKLFKRRYRIRKLSLLWWIAIIITGGFIVAGLYSWILLAWAVFY